MTERNQPTRIPPAGDARSWRQSRGRPTRVLVVGRLASGSVGACGQVAKTRFLLAELIRCFGDRNVSSVDTGGGWMGLVRAQSGLLAHCHRTDVLVAAPGERAVRWLLPQYCAWKALRDGHVHLVAIGGWLGRLAAAEPKVAARLARCDGVYVETGSMVRELHALGLTNVHHLPNAKRFDSVNVPAMPHPGPVRAVFLSRVIPAKGVGVAVESVLAANASRPGCCTLDIYGPVPRSCAEWFDSLRTRFGESVRYRGVVPPSDVQSALRGYEVMLFPTVYPGEGLAGVLLDAMIGGLAPIVSDWLGNAEFVQDGHNGFVVPPREADAFASRLLELHADRQLLLRMRRHSAGCAARYHADAVMRTLLDRIAASQGMGG